MQYPCALNFTFFLPPDLRPPPPPLGTDPLSFMGTDPSISHFPQGDRPLYLPFPSRGQTLAHENTLMGTDPRSYGDRPLKPSSSSRGQTLAHPGDRPSSPSRNKRKFSLMGTDPSTFLIRPPMGTDPRTYHSTYHSWGQTP